MVFAQMEEWGSLVLRFNTINCFTRWAHRSSVLLFLSGPDGPRSCGHSCRGSGNSDCKRMDRKEDGRPKVETEEVLSVLFLACAHHEIL